MSELLSNNEKWLIEFDGLAVLDKDRHNRTRSFGFNLVEHLHGFDDAHGFTFLNLLAQ